MMLRDGAHISNLYLHKLAKNIFREPSFQIKKKTATPIFFSVQVLKINTFLNL